MCVCSCVLFVFNGGFFTLGFQATIYVLFYTRRAEIALYLFSELRLEFPLLTAWSSTRLSTIILSFSRLKARPLCFFFLAFITSRVLMHFPCTRRKCHFHLKCPNPSLPATPINYKIYTHPFIFLSSFVCNPSSKRGLQDFTFFQLCLLLYSYQQIIIELKPTLFGHWLYLFYEEVNSISLPSLSLFRRSLYV